MAADAAVAGGGEPAALLPGAKTPVRFKFTPVGRANWQIDDVYVDPWMRR